jgi:predicted nucleic acid-binding protein
MEKLDAGEEDAIAPAVELHADLILMDDRDGVLVARSKGFRVAGTLGVLSMAAEHGYQQEVMDQLLAENSGTY